MSPNSYFKAISAATLLAVLLATTKGADTFPDDAITPLRAEACRKGIPIGSGAINPTYLDDPQFSTVLSEQFESLSPENEMKWSFINLSKGNYNWDTIDRLVGFAKNNNMVVKGHGLISSCCNPDYLLNITDPAFFRSAMTAHFEAVMHRYDGSVDRWEVVTEAIKTNGGGLNVNDFYKFWVPDTLAMPFISLGRRARIPSFSLTKTWSNLIPASVRNSMIWSLDWLQMAFRSMGLLCKCILP